MSASQLSNSTNIDTKLLSSDAEDPLYVYDWRLEPERKMRKEKGSGMSDEKVINFINGCKSLQSQPLQQREFD